MTTEELKKEVKELGLILKFYSIGKYSCYQIKDKDGEYYSEINLTRECAADINEEIFEDPEKQRKLFNVVTEFAATPIEERNSKRYFRYRLKPISNTIDSLLYYLKYDAHFGAFVLESIDVCNDFEVIFEENDPLLKDVNLKLFVTEEVDQEGNEL